MQVEGIWSDNEHTTKGTLLHKKTDEKGYENTGSAKIIRALPLYSQNFGLSGKADVVEFRRDGEIIPVEYKKGKRRKFDNDEIQLTAQTICLEEMFEKEIKRGFIYHAASKKRREVLIGDELRQQTFAIIERVRDLIAKGIIPKAEYKPRCNGCSLYGTCLPKLSDSSERTRILENQTKD